MQAKAENAAGAVKDTANQAADKAADATNTTKDKANQAADKAADATNTSHGEAQEKKEEAAGILQQVGQPSFLGLFLDLSL